MPSFPRDLPHLYLRGSGKPEPYTSKSKPPRKQLPQRDRYAHAQALRSAFDEALLQAENRQQQIEADLFTGKPGFYVDFQVPRGSESVLESLESRGKGIELVSVSRTASEEATRATVFIPATASDYFLRKVDEYGNKETKTGKPKNEALVARIDDVALSDLLSLYTDELALLPAAGERVWWEIWLRGEGAAEFDSIARKLNLLFRPENLVFPEREVRLVFADIAELGRLFLNSGCVAELRRAKDTPALFVTWSNSEQALWAEDLLQRLVPPQNGDVSVCLLDTGATRSHPLLRPWLDEGDVHSYDPTWAAEDKHGHGTNMAGLALYGDLMPRLQATGPMQVGHRLEIVKILPDEGENSPRLYGAITREAIARAEIAAPDRRRATCLAVTSDLGTTRGRPSSWSAAVDQLCFGDGDFRRLILISAGNIRTELSHSEYPARNDAEPIENPAQAWNAVTIGAYTEKTILADPTFAEWSPLAPAGELSPTSRTSVSWERQWPIKPDVLLEGGNWASDGQTVDCPDDLGLLTTFRDPTVRHFDIFRDTSAATALGGNLAAQIFAAVPTRWPESIRAAIIHSAEWTPAMQSRFASSNTEQQRLALLRRYGYGVASYERAVLSAANDLTLVVEDELEPFKKVGSAIKTSQMNLHEFVWPRAELEHLGDAQVTLRVTLSYFVEPNPGERGWLRRHQYASHGLRFAAKRSLETVDEFRKRINAAIRAEEEAGITAIQGEDNWRLGRIRNRGAVHSDYWVGTAAELARRHAVAVYPVGGWWKDNPAQERYGRKVRYALLVSIRAGSASVDIYTPVKLQITVPLQVET